MMIPYDHRTIETNGINLHVVQAGPENGLLAILLHGFPEFWYGWKKQMNFLAENGFRVWCPDQRGYNLSDKPSGIAAYNLDKLAADVIGLVDASGQDKVFLAGHDWGGAVAWWIAIRHPERVNKLVIANLPHPAVYTQHLRSNPSQMLKSVYFLFFQLPTLPEALIRRNNYKAGLDMLVKSGQPHTFTEEDLQRYREAWSQPGALTAMLNWYRATLRSRPALPDDVRIHVPTLVIWGARDIALNHEMAQDSVEMCDNGRLVMFEDASHWVQHDKATEVGDLMLQFWHE